MVQKVKLENNSEEDSYNMTEVWQVPKAPICLVITHLTMDPSNFSLTF